MAPGLESKTQPSFEKTYETGHLPADSIDLAGCLRQAATQTTFALASNYIVGNDPSSVVAADVNGDGKLDLISANQNDATLTVLTNNGTGGFGFYATLAVRNHPRSIASADVNGDGKLDLISANYFTNALSLLMNTSIFPPPTFTPTLAINPSSKSMTVSWPSVSPGWSLQQNLDLATSNWSPSGYSGYPIADDGKKQESYRHAANRKLILPPIASVATRTFSI
jgi:hypothetical protein